MVQLISNTELMSDCKNAMHLFEILLVVPFTNALVERLFSHMNRVKTDFRNRLNRSRLGTCLRGEDRSTSIEDFNADRVIECWWNEKRWCLQCCNHTITLLIKYQDPLNMSTYLASQCQF